MTLPLQSGQILSLNSTTNTSWLWSMWGAEIIGGVPNYKTLAQGNQLSAVNAWQSFYQVPAGRTAFVSHLVVIQYAPQPYNSFYNILVGTGNNGYLANPVLVPGGGWASWDADGGWHIWDSWARRIT